MGISLACRLSAGLQRGFRFCLRILTGPQVTLVRPSQCSHQEEHNTRRLWFCLIAPSCVAVWSDFLLQRSRKRQKSACSFLPSNQMTWFWFCWEIDSHSVDQAGLKLEAVPLSQSPESWDSKCEPPCLALSR